MKEEPNYDYLQVILLCIQNVQEPTKKLLELLKYFRKASGLKKINYEFQFEQYQNRKKFTS